MRIRTEHCWSRTNDSVSNHLIYQSEIRSPLSGTRQILLLTFSIDSDLMNSKEGEEKPRRTKKIMGFLLKFTGNLPRAFSLSFFLSVGPLLSLVVWSVFLAVFHVSAAIHPLFYEVFL